MNGRLIREACVYRPSLRDNVGELARVVGLFHELFRGIPVDDSSGTFACYWHDEHNRVKRRKRAKVLNQQFNCCVSSMARYAGHDQGSRVWGQPRPLFSKNSLGDPVGLLGLADLRVSEDGVDSYNDYPDYFHAVFFKPFTATAPFLIAALATSFGLIRFRIFTSRCAFR